MNDLIKKLLTTSLMIPLVFLPYKKVEAPDLGDPWDASHYFMKRDNKKMVIVDGAHGESNKILGVMDPGKTRYLNNKKDTLYREVDISMKQINTIENMLDPNEYVVEFTKEEISDPLWVKARPYVAMALAQHKDSSNVVYISMHADNFWWKNIRGFRVYYADDSSKPFAKILTKNLAEVLPIKKGDPLKIQYHMIKGITRFPAVLVECGFMTNKYDMEYILNTDLVEIGITRGINEYFALQEKERILQKDLLSSKTF